MLDVNEKENTYLYAYGKEGFELVVDMNDKGAVEKVNTSLLRLRYNSQRDPKLYKITSFVPYDEFLEGAKEQKSQKDAFMYMWTKSDTVQNITGLI